MRRVSSTEEYVRILEEHELVLVEFYSDSVPSSRYFSAVMEDVAERLGARTVYLRVNADALPGIMEEAGLKALPAAALYYRGRLVWSQEGCFEAYSKDVYVVRKGIKEALRRIGVELRF